MFCLLVFYFFCIISFSLSCLPLSSNIDIPTCLPSIIAWSLFLFLSMLPPSQTLFGTRLLNSRNYIIFPLYYYYNFCIFKLLFQLLLLLFFLVLEFILF